MSDTASDVSALMLAQAAEVPATVPSPVRVLGIDLGTTNSTVAEVVWTRDQAQPPVARCLEIEQPTETGAYIHVLVPSVVALHQGQVWVGEGAKRLRANASLRRNKDIFYECNTNCLLKNPHELRITGYGIRACKSEIRPSPTRNWYKNDIGARRT